MNTASHYFVSASLNILKGPALSLLMLCIVILLVRHPPGCVSQRRVRMHFFENDRYLAIFASHD
jgi:hypothetical protein